VPAGSHEPDVSWLRLPAQLSIHPMHEGHCRAMVDPITLSIVEMVGEPAAKRLMEWAKGSEANQLVKLLKPRFPNAYKLLTQPSVLVEIYVYAESGVFRKAEMLRALRAITDSTQQADDLAEAIRENQWRVMRDDRQAHQELRRLRTEIGGDISAVAPALISRDGDIEPLARLLAANRTREKRRDVCLIVVDCRRSGLALGRERS
jgi:hypothetical protein